MFHKSDSNQIDADAFSSREEDLLEAMDINFNLLSHFSYYLTNNVKEFIDETLQSNIVANYIIEKIINECGKRLYDKYIDVKLPPFVLNHSKEYLEILNNMEFQMHDKCDLGIETLKEDLEPVFLYQFLIISLIAIISRLAILKIVG